jgi:hypothetical protein
VNDFQDAFPFLSLHAGRFPPQKTRGLLLDRSLIPRCMNFPAILLYR